MCLTEAKFALLTIVYARGRLGAGYAFPRIIERRERATFAKRNCFEKGTLCGEDVATSEAVTSVRRERRAEVLALLRLRLPRWADVWVLCFLRIVLTDDLPVLRVTRVERIALRVPLASVVTGAAVSVEEAVLFAVDVVAWNSGRETRFVVVEASGAFRIEKVSETVAVIVFAIGTCSKSGNTTEEAAVRQRGAA